MIKLNFYKSIFLKNVATLSIGTIISQLVLVISSPLLSRIYFVESFGNLAIFTSITSFFAVLSTGRYELAIILPNKDNDSYKLIKLIFIIGLVISTLYLFILIILKYILNYCDKIGFLAQKEAFIAPFYIFFISVHSALTYWFQRKRKYKIIAMSNAIQVLSSTCFGLILGYCFNCQTGMIYALFAGMILSSTFYLFIDKNILWNVMKQRSILVQFKKYVNFPKYSTFTDLATVANNQFIPIFFSFLYNTTVLGYFSFANRIVRLPNIVITSAFANVFRNAVMDELRLRNNCRSIFLSTLKKLIIISFPVYLLLFISTPYLFSTLFGENWHISGDYAQIVSIFLFFEFVATPLSTLFYISGKQRLLMFLQILNSCTGAISLFIGYFLYQNEYVSLVLFSLNSCLFSTIILFKTYKISKFELIA